jgi:hypothetical protein
VDAKKAAKIKKKKGTSSKNSPRSEEGSSVLERAEKLCKELRDKREKAKKDLHSKEKAFPLLLGLDDLLGLLVLLLLDLGELSVLSLDLPGLWLIFCFIGVLEDI